jgi:hypothetical protein
MADLARRGFEFKMSVPGVEPVRVKLQGFTTAIGDFTPFWRDYAAPLLFDRAQRNIETRGGFAPYAWAPLSPGYAAWKAKRFPSQGLMRRTDRLFNSLSYNNGAAGPGGIARFSKTHAEMGTSVPYAMHHQRGTRRMPQRVILPLANSETWGRLLQRFVMDVRKATRLGENV